MGGMNQVDPSVAVETPDAPPNEAATLAEESRELKAREHYEALDNLNMIRELGFRFWWHDLWRFTWVCHTWRDHIRPIFAPQHAELRAAIPRTWADLDHCIDEFLLACVISFVECEKGLEDWSHPEQEGFRKAHANELREVYEWAKTGRAAFQDRISAAAPKGDFDEMLARDWSAYHALDTEFEQYNEAALKWILINRGTMWT